MTENHGKIVCRLEILKAERGVAEQRTISYAAIARDTGLAAQTLQNLAGNRTRAASRGTLATLCWYFGCRVGELLMYNPPSGWQMEALPEVRRAMVQPRVGEIGDVRTHLLVLMAEKSRPGKRCTYQRIGDAVGLTSSLLSRLANGKINRFDLVSLSRLCWYFRCGVDHVLEYVPSE